MRPTEILKSEHRVIEQVLTCLDRIADEAKESGSVPVKAAGDALRFLREFADGCHHKKEEDRLFPMLESRGMPKYGGPTDVMRTEHEQGRALIRTMAQSLESAGAGERAVVQSFVRAARDYVQLLRAHIQKEDHCLFAMADNLLSLDDQDRLEEAFEAVEREQEKPCTHRHCLEIAANLVKQFGVSEAAIESAAAQDRCCVH